MDDNVNSVVFWVVASLVMLTLEATAVPGIGLLYAGLSALSAAFILAFGWVDGNDLLRQTACFTALTAAWAALLWGPMKRLNRKPQGGSSGLVGGKARVCETDLKKGATGQVRWSGAYMNAVIDPREAADTLPAGSEVIIAGTEGNTLIVASPGSSFLRHPSEA